MKPVLVQLASFLLALVAAVAAPFGDGFVTGKANEYLEGDLPSEKIRIEARNGRKSLVVTDTHTQFKTVAVPEGKALRLSFEASFSGAVESIEDNPRFAIFAHPSERSSVLPAREIQFLDREGKATGRTLIFSMPFRENHRYVDAFHVPPNAVALRLKISSGKGVALRLRNLNLDELPDAEGVLNINPAFALGMFNYSGWANVSAGGSLIEVDGKTIFDSKYGSRGTTFPLAGPGTYALSATAIGNGYNATVHLDVCDAAGDKLMRSTLRRFDQTNHFVVPPGATSASLLVYSCLLENVRVTRVGGEEAIDKLRDRQGETTTTVQSEDPNRIRRK